MQEDTTHYSDKVSLGKNSSEYAFGTTKGKILHCNALLSLFKLTKFHSLILFLEMKPVSSERLMKPKHQVM